MTRTHRTEAIWDGGGNYRAPLPPEWGKRCPVLVVDATDLPDNAIVEPYVPNATPDTEGEVVAVIVRPKPATERVPWWQAVGRQLALIGDHAKCYKVSAGVYDQRAWYGHNDEYITADDAGMVEVLAE
jgi:hypothetical protein